MRKNLIVYQQILVVLRRYPKLITALLISSFFSVFTEGLGLGLILPLLQPTLASNFLAPYSQLAPLIDWVQQLTILERVRMAAIVLLGIVLLRNVLVIASRFAALKLQEQIEYDFKMQTMRQLHALELRYMHRQQMGGLFTTLTQYTWQATWMMNFVTGAVADGFALVVYMCAMVLVSWPLTLFAAGLLVLILILNSRFFLERLRQLGEAEAQSDRDVRALALESLSAMKLLHLFRKEETNINRFEQTLHRSQQAAYSGKRITALLMPVFSFLSVLLLSTMLLTATYMVPDQIESWLGRLVIFLGIIFRLMGPASKLNFMNGNVSKFAPAFQSLLEFLRQDDKPFLPDGTLHHRELRQQIVLENIRFRYLSDEPLVLNNVTFAIPKGKMTALVGPSGSGKSTIVDLVARLFDPDEGRVMVDDTDVRDLTLSSWRTSIAVVSQNSFLFHDTVRNNLRFVKPEASAAEIEKAARLAQAHKFIMELPQGYETLLGDRGIRLSGGQQQRIAIARALLAEPQILILDEATSDLDSETERALQHAIDKFGRDRTLLVIAHRLSTIRAADNIIVLANGCIVEQGTHEELLGAQNAYWRLVQAQAFDDSPDDELPVRTEEIMPA